MKISEMVPAFNLFLAVNLLLNLRLVSATPATSALKARAVSPDASCGGSAGYTCLGSSFGSCCSAYGWCGSTDAYCGTGCQSAFGTCGTNPASSSVISRSTTSSATPTASTTLTDCLNNKNIPISLISSPNFAQLAQPYNLRLPYTPVVIVLPTTPQHISDAVVCAGKYGVKVQAKSGGHSYASFSSGGKDGSMVIDLEPLQNIVVDATTGIAVVGGGVRLGNLALGIYNQAQRALPHGTCPGVGIGGHFTHGGYGYDSRLWGLALDTIVGLDVVLANGSYIHATSTEYSDIYWALRGAADSFGIVVNFYLQTQPAPTTVINWSYSFSGMFSSQETFTNTFLHIQDFAQNASVVDGRLGFGIYLDGSGYSLGGTFIGTEDEFNQKIAPELLRGLPSSTPSVKALGWIDSLTALSNEASLQEPLTGYNAHDTFFAKSITVPESGPLTAAALNSYFAYITQTAKPSSWFSIINLYGGPGSAINSRDTTFSSYSDRSSLWVFQNYGFTSGGALPSATIGFIDGMNNAIENAQPQTQFGAYLNYVDPSLDPETAHSLYYGTDVYNRLLAIKQVVDPGMVFWNPQAIGVA